MNELKRITEFRRVLGDYHLSDAARQVLEKITFVLMVGPTSSGKNSIIQELQKTGHYHYTVSDTTRKPRANNGILEQDGREYWFRTEDQVLQDLEAGAFLEAAIIHNQQVSGTSIRELQTAAEEGKIALNEIEVVGAENVHSAKPDTMFFFVLPPSFDEWMVRMRIRGELPPDEMKRRFESAVMELETALSKDYYWFIVNDTFVQTAHKIDAIVAAKAQDSETQEHGRQVAEQLLTDTKAHLADL